MEPLSTFTQIPTPRMAAPANYRWGSTTEKGRNQRRKEHIWRCMKLEVYANVSVSVTNPIWIRTKMMPLERNIIALRNPLHAIFLFTASEGYEQNGNEDWSREFMNNNFIHTRLKTFSTVSMLAKYIFVSTSLWACCLFVCEQNNLKSYQRILMEFSLNVDHGTRNRWLHFGDVLD